MSIFRGIVRRSKGKRGRACPRCNTPIDDDTLFCGICGLQIAPHHVVVNITGVEQQQSGSEQMGLSSDSQSTSYSSEWASQEQKLSQPLIVPPVSFQPQVSFSEQPRSWNMKRVAFLASILILLVSVVSSGLVVLFRHADASKSPLSANQGIISFLDSQTGQGQTDTVQISTSALGIPHEGMQYNAWLVDQANEQIFPLGQLMRHSSSYTLMSTENGKNLLGLGDKLIITEEKGSVNLPTGKILLSATFPSLAFMHIRHLLVNFPAAPNGTGLLVGLLDQTRLLNAQALLLQTAIAKKDTTAIQCAAQGMLNLIEGNQGQHVHPLKDVCAHLNVTVNGDGFGLLGQGYLDKASAHTSLAATQPDSTSNIKLHARRVLIAIENIKGWLATVDQDVNTVFTNPNDTTSLQEIISLSEHCLNGVDTNNDEHVDPVPGEAGAMTAYLQGQAMAQFELTQDE